MEPATFEHLLEPARQKLLAQLSAIEELSETTALRHLGALRKAGAEPELARAALETELLRRRARVKFERAAEVYFNRGGPAPAGATSRVPPPSPSPRPGPRRRADGCSALGTTSRRSLSSRTGAGGFP